MVTDDLPWPELGNVSRGATRGNQGQKGVLGPPDHDGCSVLQLRVQPGVLAVRLNAQATEWYGILDAEVNRALKLTKTYWRKARRRQDYDARADQDHMELHEWLQQLKDKTMSHLEVLMQKGDIQGPPYNMPDGLELTFLRKFVDRHTAGIPHNPRLRLTMKGKHPVIRDASVELESTTSETSDYGFARVPDSIDQVHRLGESSSSKCLVSTQISKSPRSRNLDSVMHEANASRKELVSARDSLLQAQKETQDAFMRYNVCLETERQARQEVSAAEKRRDDIMAILLSHTKSPSEPSSRKSSESLDEHRSPPIHHPELGERMVDRDQRKESLFQKLPTQAVHDFRQSPGPVGPLRQANRPSNFTNADDRVMYSDNRSTSSEDTLKLPRKHSRSWDHESEIKDNQYICERDSSQDVGTLPPRKRAHHFTGGFDMLSNVALQSQQDMAQPS